MKNFWLVKQEPSDYSWTDFVKDGGTTWTGVRNFAARNNLRRMSKSDQVLFYHSGEDKAVVGIAKVTRAAYGPVCVSLNPGRSWRLYCTSTVPPFAA